jgi:2-oxoisovalerate dehydrogenase E1 component
MFVDFLFEAASQIIEQAAKLRYMSNGQLNVPVVIRASIGTVEKGAGPHHSGTYYPLWSHCPGLIVVVPSNPADAKGLMKTALRASDPVLFLEHKSLFGLKGPTPVEERYIPFGRAAVVREGTSLTMVTCGELVHRSLEAARQLAEEEIDCEIIDLRTIVPLDIETILESVAKTGHALVVDEAFPMCGIGAEISATIMEEAFDQLDAPVGRLHPLPVTHPCSPVLQNAMMVSVEKIIHSARCVLAGTPIGPLRPTSGIRKQSHLQTSTATRQTETPATAKPKPVPGAGAVPILPPNQDLTVTEATVLRWLKKVGDVVRTGEPLVEIETAKSVSAIEAPASGVLEAILFAEGEIVEFAKKQPLGLVRAESHA